MKTHFWPWLMWKMRCMPYSLLRSILQRARVDHPINQIPKWLLKARRLRNRGKGEVERGVTSRLTCALGCGADLQIRRSIPALSSRLAAVIGRSFSPRETHTCTRVWLSHRLNIPDAYHDNNSVATVALFDWPRLVSAGEIWVQIRTIYHVNVSALLRELEKSRYLCVIENIENAIFKKISMLIY